ncbi:MAG: hypothetical protein AB8G96_05590 [Phycisphaerales bacterium]
MQRYQFGLSRVIPPAGPSPEAVADETASVPDVRLEIRGGGRPGHAGARVLSRLTAPVVGRASIQPTPDGSLLGQSVAAWQRASRAELGWPLENPLVMSGHQPGAWHPGVLAKYALLAALAETGDVAVADVLVEQDDGAPLEMEIPIRDERTAGLGVARISWASVPGDRALGFRPPSAVRTAEAAGLGPFETVPAGAADRVAALGRALAAADGPTLAEQVRAANISVLPEQLRPPAARTTGAILATEFGRALVAAMVDDPWGAARAYNTAVRAVAAAGGPRLTELHVRDDFVELPLWRVSPDGQRRRADDVDAAAWLEGGGAASTAIGASGDVLRPRALLLTAIVRLGIADVFVHGTGGGAYDEVMERWVALWLGVLVPPCVVCTADLRLPGAGRGPSLAERDARVAEAHRVWHDPEADDLDGRRIVPERTDRRRGASSHPPERRPGPTKRELLAEIDRLPRGSRARRSAYRLMHDQLASLRGVHVGRVESAVRRARAAVRGWEDARILARRDWPAIVHPPASLERLATVIKDRVKVD